MITHEIRTTFDQPVDKVFDFLVDLRNEPSWNPDCLLVEKTSEGPVGLGTTFTGKVKGMGTLESRIVALDRLEGYTVANRGRGMEANCDFRFAPSEGGTRLTMGLQAQTRGPMRLFEPVVRRMMRRMLDELPEKMRQGVESAA